MFKNRVEKIINNEELSALRKFQLTALEMLIELDKICKDNNITYWADSGTLLGAVRHKGFIPWDDDVDICIPRDDYENLRALLEKNILPDGIVYEDKYTDTWYQEDMNVKPSFIKLYYLDHFKGFDHHENANWRGTFIDIFPVDEVTEKMCENKFNILTMIVSRRVMRNQKGIANNIKSCLGKLNLDKIWIKKCKKVKLTHNCNYVVYGVETPFMGKKYMQEKANIYPLKELDFEDYKLPVPNNYHNYLTNQYGDYMSIPKIEDRHTHVSNIKIV